MHEKPKHTPGPWTYETGQNYIHEENTGYTVARICADSGHVNPKYCEAMPVEENARLIAAAPELLQACRALLAADDAICENIGRKSDQAMQRIAAIDAAHAAINKTDGR